MLTLVVLASMHGSLREKMPWAGSDFFAQFLPCLTCPFAWSIRPTLMETSAFLVSVGYGDIRFFQRPLLLSFRGPHPGGGADDGEGPEEDHRG